MIAPFHPANNVVDDSVCRRDRAAAMALHPAGSLRRLRLADLIELLLDALLDEGSQGPGDAAESAPTARTGSVWPAGSESPAQAGAFPLEQ